MTEEKLKQLGYRKYEGEKITIYFNRKVCQHSGVCTTGNPQVFAMKRVPWIVPLPDQTESIKEVIGSCPSGALKYRLKNSSELLPK